MFVCAFTDVKNEGTEYGVRSMECIPFIFPTHSHAFGIVVKGCRPVYSGTSDNGHSEELNNLPTMDKLFTPCLYNCPYISTSEEGKTSEQWTKRSSQTRPLFRGSTSLGGTSISVPVSAVCG